MSGEPAMEPHCDATKRILSPKPSHYESRKSDPHPQDFDPRPKQKHGFKPKLRGRIGGKIFWGWGRSVCPHMPNYLSFFRSFSRKSWRLLGGSAPVLRAFDMCSSIFSSARDQRHNPAAKLPRPQPLLALRASSSCALRTAQQSPAARLESFAGMASSTSRLRVGPLMSFRSALGVCGRLCRMSLQQETAAMKLLASVLRLCAKDAVPFQAAEPASSEQPKALKPPPPSLAATCLPYPGGQSRM